MSGSFQEGAVRTEKVGCKDGVDLGCEELLCEKSIPEMSLLMLSEMAFFFDADGHTPPQKLGVYEFPQNPGKFFFCSQHKVQKHELLFLKTAEGTAHSNFINPALIL